MTLDLHVLCFELLKDVLGSLTTDFNPLPGEEGTSAEDEGDVEESMDGVSDHGRESLRGTNHVSETSDRDGMSSVV